LDDLELSDTDATRVSVLVEYQFASGEQRLIRKLLLTGEAVYNETTRLVDTQTI
jgi:hypothetical protein